MPQRREPRKRNTEPLKDSKGNLIGYLSLTTGELFTVNGNPSDRVRGNEGSLYDNKAHEARVAAALRYTETLKEKADEAAKVAEGTD